VHQDVRERDLELDLLATQRGGGRQDGDLGKRPGKLLAYIDGQLCGVDDAGLPSFAHTQAATDGERDVRLVYYAFDLLHLDGRNVSALPLIERKALLGPLIADTLGVQFNGHETGDGELILKHAGKLGFEGVVPKTLDAPCAPGNRGLPSSV
jgi:bifunctional non-homologous end joining protein LigD